MIGRLATRTLVSAFIFILCFGLMLLPLLLLGSRHGI